MKTEELPTVDTALEALKKRKNVLMGGSTVAILAVVLVLFVKNQMAESKVRPWRQLFAQEMPWAADPDAIASVAPDIAGTPAEPLSVYWEAVRRFEEGQTDQANQRLAYFIENFGEHYLVNRSLPNPEASSMTDEGGLTPVAERILAQFLRLRQWDERFPAPTANPAPTGTDTVTLVTDQGDIVLALFTDQAPLSCKQFLALSTKLTDTYIVTTSTGQWIEAGQTTDGQGLSLAEDGFDGFPAYEETGLYHFEGAVTFKQPPFTQANLLGDLRIWLSTDFTQQGRSTVFATVVSGLDVLKNLSEGEKSTDRPLQLANPVKINEVRANSAAAEGTTVDDEPPAEENAEAESGEG
jgi:cyclophilin family peptidyl-prolyl cis-trans isomerase